MKTRRGLSALKKFGIALACAVLLSGVCYVFAGSFRVWLNHTVYETLHPEIVGGMCGPNCEAVNEYPKDRELKNTATLPDFHADPEDRIVLAGKIFGADGLPLYSRDIHLGRNIPNYPK